MFRVLGCANLRRDCQALLIVLRAEHDNLARAAQLGNEERHHADWTWSLDDDGVARAQDWRLLHQGIVGDANRLSQRRLLKADVGWDVMQDLLPRRHKLREKAPSCKAP